MPTWSIRKPAPSCDFPDREEILPFWQIGQGVKKVGFLYEVNRMSPTGATCWQSTT